MVHFFIQLLAEIEFYGNVDSFLLTIIQNPLKVCLITTMSAIFVNS